MSICHQRPLPPILWTSPNPPLSVLSKMKQKKWHTEKALYRTTLGKYYCARSEELLNNRLGSKLENSVQLILTSPPFPLNNKKRYGNLQGAQYKEWFIQFAETFSGLLKEDGSIVIELGNSWLPNRPIQSLLHLDALLAFVNHPRAGLRLCQEFICYNPARLPTPAQWVTVNRIRTIDSYTHVWWMAKTDFPKADNRKVLRPYSKSMEALLAKQTYNWGKRPSEHNISKKGFLKNRGGSIVHNLIELQNIRPDEERPRLPENILRTEHVNENETLFSSI